MQKEKGANFFQKETIVLYTALSFKPKPASGVTWQEERTFRRNRFLMPEN